MAGAYRSLTGHSLTRAVMQGLHRLHQYQVCGRHLPSEKEPEPTIYRMKLWAPDPVRAKSKFWCAPCCCCQAGVQSAGLASSSICVRRYFLRKLRKVKKAHGQVLAVNEVSD